MKKTNITLLITLICALILTSAFYFSLSAKNKWSVAWMAKSVVKSATEFSACSSRLAEEQGIESDFLVIEDHIISSVKTGMTSDEVEKTLSEFSPITIKDTYFTDEQEKGERIIMTLCNNRLWNIVINVRYSQDGHLINIRDSFED